MDEVQKSAKGKPSEDAQQASGALNPGTIDNSDNADAEIRATFIVSASLAGKLKLIATLERRKIKEVVGKALAGYVSQWEARHPSMDLDQIDSMVSK